MIHFFSFILTPIGRQIEVFVILRPSSFFTMMPLLLFILSTLTPSPVKCTVILESGYSVSTVADFSKPPSTLYPFSLLPLHRSNDLLLLDSTKSAFYSLPIPLSKENGVSLFSGKGGDGFSDGDKMEAMFHKPRSFAIDGRDNVYVADRLNHAIRKINSFGSTTTIAGGYSQKSGHIDGPAQNASFSDDFDLVYAPRICALLISDRGNRLIRQLDLKPEDCAQKPQGGLGAAPVSVIAVLSLLIGLVFGFAARSFFAHREIFINRSTNKTWKHYLTSLEKVVQTTYSGIRSAVANFTVSRLMLKLVNMGLCYLSIVFRNIRLAQCSRKKTSFKASSLCREPVSFVESDVVSDHYLQKPQAFTDELENLISFDEVTDVLEVSKSFEQQCEKEETLDSNHCKIDDVINANLVAFSSQPKEQIKVEDSTAYGTGLVHRRAMRVESL